MLSSRRFSFLYETSLNIIGTPVLNFLSLVLDTNEASFFGNVSAFDKCNFDGNEV